MFVNAATGGGTKRGAIALLLALLAAIVIAAAAAATPARAAPPGQSNVRISGLEIVSDPLLSARASDMILQRPVLALTGGTASGAHTWYAAGDVITVEVTFSGPVRLVTWGDGPTQSLTLNIGSAAAAAQYAGAVDGDASVHRFTHTVAANERDNDGLSIAANALQLHRSWFVAQDEDCEAWVEYVPQPGGHGDLGGYVPPRVSGDGHRESFLMVRVEHPFTCHQRGVDLDLTNLTITNNHQHRVRAQTPERAHTLAGGLIDTYGGNRAVQLEWEYSALVSDNRPTRFVITRTELAGGATPVKDSKYNAEFRVAPHLRRYIDRQAGPDLAQNKVAAYQYRIYAENAYGPGAGDSVVVDAPPR